MVGVARIQPRPRHHAMAVRDLVAVVQSGFDVLKQSDASSHDWHRLHLDAVGAFVRAQKHFVALHGDILAVIQSDRLLYASLRLASLDMTQALTQLRELIASIAKAVEEADRR